MNLSEILEYNILTEENIKGEEFELGGLKITIIGIDTFEHKLIKI